MWTIKEGEGERKREIKRKMKSILYRLCVYDDALPAPRGRISYEIDS